MTSVGNLESYFETLMTQSPKYFLQQIYKLVEKTFKLTFTNLALNEFLLYDLARIDDLYTGSLDTLSKGFNQKSKKLEKALGKISPGKRFR